MRVLHVVPSLSSDSGGPARSVPELCRALSLAGVEVTLYAAWSRGDSLTIDRTREPFRCEMFASSAGRLGASLELYNGIRSNSTEFDLIHIHSLWNPIATMAARAARASRVPYVIAPRGMLGRVCMQKGALRKRAYGLLFERRTIEGAAMLHYLNRNEFAEADRSWFKADECFIAPNGAAADIGPIASGGFRKRFPELMDRTILLFLGRLDRIKGLELQIEALELLAATHPRIVWVAVGPDAGDWPRIDSLIKSKRLEAHAKWLGPLDGYSRYEALADADVVLQTSHHECHSISINEALAVGAPLVISHEAHFDCVESSGAGFVVERNGRTIAEAVERILNSNTLAEQMREAGRKLARERLSWERIADSVIKEYRDIISRRTPAIGQANFHRSPFAAAGPDERKDAAIDGQAPRECPYADRSGVQCL